MAETAKKARGKKGKKRICSFCVDKIAHVDYKDVNRLRKFITERGKILPGGTLEIVRSVSVN